MGTYESSALNFNCSPPPNMTNGATYWQSQNLYYLAPLSVSPYSRGTRARQAHLPSPPHGGPVTASAACLCCVVLIFLLGYCSASNMVSRIHSCPCNPFSFQN